MYREPMQRLTFRYVCHEQCRRKLSSDVGAYIFVLLKVLGLVFFNEAFCRIRKLSHFHSTPQVRKCTIVGVWVSRPCFLTRRCRVEQKVGLYYTS